MDLVLFSAIPKVALFFLLLVAAAIIAEVIYLAKKKMDSPEVNLPKSLQNLPGQKPLPAMAAVTTEIISETPKKGRLTRKTTTIIISTLLIALTIPVGLALVKQRQVVQKQAAGSNPISVSCTDGNPPRGLLIVHQFSSEAACKNCKNDPTDCVRKLVGQPSDTNVCPSGNNYIGTTTNPYDGKPTVCTDLGNCSNNTCSGNFPDCSAVQIDCLNNLGGGINAGNPMINCNNCGPAPTPTPTPTIPNCTSLTTTTDLNNLHVGTEYSFQLTAGGTAPVTDVEMSVHGNSCSDDLKTYAPQHVSGPGTYTIKWTPAQAGPFTAYGRVWNDGIAECRSDCVDGPPRYLCANAQACKLTGTVTTTSFSMRCSSIAAFDSNWNQITNLNSITVGQTVYFATNGTTDDPQGITKARFRINADGNWQETTQKHGADFYIQYTIGAGGNYTVDAEVFNPTLGWK